ncbi:MAG: diguanylate cyclase [Rhodocyclaceae bacterium]|nr:diguanylate cyclase [Rhodocyclaceae bacterium]
MEYHDSIEKSAEYLRLALSLMTKQAAGLHPISYAVWYEYVAGINPPLRTKIDGLLKSGQAIDDAVINQLFRAHIAEMDEAVAQQVSQGFDKVMADISASTSQAADEAGQFGQALARWSADVAAGKDDATSANDVAALLHHTQDIRQTVDTLKTRLDDSRREVEELRKEVSRAREDALIDGLTGLANRRSFDAALANCLATAAPDAHGPSLLMADIDHFKRINDNYGHLFGDKVIHAIATILRENIKGKDLAARYGGEEFVIILPETPVAGAYSLAETIRKTVENSRIKRVGSTETIANVTISLGVACRRPGESELELIARADRALYQSKEQGRNRVTIDAAAS